MGNSCTCDGRDKQEDQSDQIFHKSASLQSLNVTNGSHVKNAETNQLKAVEEMQSPKDIYYDQQIPGPTEREEKTQKPDLTPLQASYDQRQEDRKIWAASVTEQESKLESGVADNTEIGLGSYGNTPMQIETMDPNHKAINIDIEEEVIDKIRIQIDAGETPEILKGDYSKINIALNNNLEYPLSHPFFDPHNLVEKYMSQNPKLNSNYKFHGLWKPCPTNEQLESEAIIIILTQQVKKDWGVLGQVVNHQRQSLQLSEDKMEQMKKAFNAMDKDGDGVINRDELKNLLSGLGEDVNSVVLDSMIKNADENGDGQIQFDEFFNAASMK